MESLGEKCIATNSCSKTDLKQTSFTSQGMRKIKHTTKNKASRKKETTNIKRKKINQRLEKNRDPRTVF